MLENGVEIVLYSEFSIVVVTWDHQTHRQLVGIFLEVPYFVYPLPFVSFSFLLLCVPTLVDLVVEGCQKYALKVFSSIQKLSPLLVEGLSSLSRFLIV